MKNINTRLLKDMKLVYASKNKKTKVYAIKTVNKSNLVNAIKVIAIDEEGNVSEPVIFMDYLDESFVENRMKYFAYVSDLDEEDSKIIAKNIIKKSGKFKIRYINEKMNIRELFKVLYQALNDTTLEEDKLRTNENFNIVHTSYFNEIVEGCGWKSLEVRKILLEMDMLNPGTGRVYDYNIKINNQNTWWLRISKKALEEEAGIKNIVKNAVGGEQ